jgi:excisionase family DNA binding protein
VQQEPTWSAPTQTAHTLAVDERLTYTLTEAAALLGISRALAYEAAHRGDLPVCRVGRRMLVPRVALLRLLDQDAATPGAQPA